MKENNNQISNIQKISNYIFVSALFLITNLEWNYFDIYTRFLPFDYVSLLGVVLVCSILYINKDIIKDKVKLFILGIEILATLVSIFVFHNLVILIFLSIIIISVFLMLNIRFTKGVALFIPLWMSLFFYYWTFDVKGYFKGYDVFYGSIILFIGFVYSFIVIEYIKFSIKVEYKRNNKIILFIKQNDYLIGFLQAFLVIWAYNIMSWYQSKITFCVTFLFIVLVILPEEISLLNLCIKVCESMRMILRFEKKEYKYNYFCNLILCAIISDLCMFIVAIYNKCTLALSAPFVIGFISLFGIFRYFEQSGDGESYHVFDSSEYRSYVKTNRIQNALLAVISTLLVIIPIGILAPVENYYSNIREFPFALKDFFGTFVIYALLITVILAIIGAILRKQSLKVLCSLLFSFGVATYIQVMFLNRKLSESDGSALDFESLGGYVMISFIVWVSIIIAICVAFIVLKDNWKKVVFFVGTGLCIVQTVAVISLPLANTRNNIAKSESYELSAENRFKVASKENIIVFVLDTIGNIQFENAVEEFPYIMDGLNDFTYYRNADCVYAWTYPSLTYMLTGNTLDPKSDWLTESWNSERTQKYYDLLHDNGYSVYMYTNYLNYVFGGGENLIGKFDNVKKYAHYVDKNLVKQKMFRYALFKTLPYKFKPRYEVLTNDLKFLDTVLCDEGDSISDADTYGFYEGLSKGLDIDDSQDKAIRIFHLDGTHYPFEINENFEKDEDASRNQVVCANIQLVKMYIEELKDKDLYDNSTIFILADHGTYIDIIDPQPIVFLKNKNDKSDEMILSDAPISHTEFMPTLLKSAGIDNRKWGITYEDVAESPKINRTVGYLSEDRSSYSFYEYYGDREELLKKFPDKPDYTMSAW